MKKQVKVFGIGFFCIAFILCFISLSFQGVVSKKIAEKKSEEKQYQTILMEVNYTK